MSIGKKVLIALIGLICLIVLVLVTYIIYLSVGYDRIPDNQKEEINGNAQNIVETDKEYSALTYNIGFGAYDRDFSFFMDKGVMNDGTEVTGKSSRAKSEDAVLTNTNGVTDTLNTESAQFNLLQEVDIEADRSKKINQREKILDGLNESDVDWVYSSNFHTSYLAYPFTEPIGSIESGLLTISEYKIRDSVRRSFPVDDGFITKFFDLDRCFTVNRIPVKGGGEFVLINIHMSAYDEGGVIRKQQFEMLSKVLTEEKEKGNWVIAAGDFNHALFDTREIFMGEQEIPEWVQPLDNTMIPDGYTFVQPDNFKHVRTVRSSDIPYTEGVNYETVLDGFLVTDNVKGVAENIDTSYEFSDHNPVLMKFSLISN